MHTHITSTKLTIITIFTQLIILGVTTQSTCETSSDSFVIQQNGEDVFVADAKKVQACSPKKDLCTSGVPIGTVIDWFRPSASAQIPAGYQLCDGSLIVSGPMTGIKTPNLIGKFIRGVNLDQVGTEGGSETHQHVLQFQAGTTSEDPGHVHTIQPPKSFSNNTGAHAHDIPIVSGKTSTAAQNFNVNTTDFTHNHKVAEKVNGACVNLCSLTQVSTVGVNLYDENGDVSKTCPCPNAILPTMFTDMDTHNHKISFSASHTHTLTTTQGQSSTANGHVHELLIPAFPSSANGKHVHSVQVPNSVVPAENHIPPYFGLVKLIKVID